MLVVRVTPRAKADRVEGVVLDAEGRAMLALRVRAAPNDGAANKAAATLLARAFDLLISRVTLIAGATQRVKRLRLDGDPQAIERACARLASEGGGG